jgi:pyruvate/2-oxoglutarate dehydrogenase complex dihydrolipoamide acyltransferase (E2) component
MKKVLAICSLTLLLVTMTVASDQPNMTAARSDLNKAENSLRKATADKGGHREKAMSLISRAIAAVNDGIDYDRSHLSPGKRGRRTGETDEMPATASSDQPHMQAAKDHLQSALNNLQRASADKGGYREKAIDLVRDAIAEVNKGIAFDRSN